MKNILFTSIIVILLSCASNDSTEEEIPVIQYNVSIVATTGGAVSNSGGRYAKGTTIASTATVFDGYTFDGWSNGSLERTLLIEVNSELNLTAIFSENETEENSETDESDENDETNAVVLEADGPGNTYDLITSILAPGYDPIEVPDCGHQDFGNHIDELYDETLEKYVFRFYLHTTPDNDRCTNFDRQRNEIKSYDKSPENLLGREDETVTYTWKFKLADGFQSSGRFTHIHQLKPVGGDLASMPMYTLTTRKSNPDRIELRYAETDRQITLTQTALAPFIGEWVRVEETITYGTNGQYSIVMTNYKTNEELLSYTNNAIINWRSGGDFVRPKWGIYRSIVDIEDLRDEEVLFADFSVLEK